MKSHIQCLTTTIVRAPLDGENWRWQKRIRVSHQMKEPLWWDFAKWKCNSKNSQSLYSPLLYFIQTSDKTSLCFLFIPFHTIQKAVKLSSYLNASQPQRTEDFSFLIRQPPIYTLRIACYTTVLQNKLLACPCHSLVPKNCFQNWNVAWPRVKQCFVCVPAWKSR